MERLEQFFVANGLTYGDEKSKAIFLTIVGKKNHTLLMDLCAPLKPSEKKLAELIDLCAHILSRRQTSSQRGTNLTLETKGTTSP